jgi:hypothetical protein
MTTYILIALVWAILCGLTGLYINGIGLSSKGHIKLGFITIGISYCIGLFALIGILIFSL